MSRFLEDFKEFVKNNDGKVFSVCEITGDGEPEKLEIRENNASQK